VFSNKCIDLGKENVEVIAKLLPLTFVKVVKSSLEHVSVYRWSIKDFFQLIKPLIQLLVNDVPFEFHEAC